MYFEIYVVHSPTNALFINLIKSFKFTLKYTIISLAKYYFQQRPMESNRTRRYKCRNKKKKM